MGVSIVKKAAIVYGLVLATVLRIIIPYAAGSRALMECTECTTSVVTYYSGISSVLFITTTLFLLGIRLANLTADWISVAYIPLLIYAIRWTFYTFIQQLKDMKDSYDVFMDELSQRWWGYFNSNETYWPNLEKKLQCCGLEGPRGYMEYLRKVPEHCYNPKLIILGCGQLVHDIYYPMQRIGHFMHVMTLFLELCLLYFYGIIVCKKLLRLTAAGNRKKVSKPSLNKSN